MEKNVLRVINFEDNIYKHMDIVKALKEKGIYDVVHVENAVDGIDIIKNYPDPNKAFDLIITDMWFPWSKGGSERKSGDMLISQLRQFGIYIPVIICSSGRFSNEYAIGSVVYNFNEPWEEELFGLLAVI